MNKTYKGKIKKYAGVPSTNVPVYATEEMMLALDSIATDLNVPKAQLVTDALVKMYRRELADRGIFFRGSGSQKLQS